MILKDNLFERLGRWSAGGNLLSPDPWRSSRGVRTISSVHLQPGVLLWSETQEDPSSPHFDSLIQHLFTF
jgi:hypothetical protein